MGAPKNEGGWRESPSCGNIVLPQDKAPKLSDMGISHKQSSRFQAVAAVPDDAFEELIADTKAAEKELTTALGEETCRSLARTLAAWAASQP